MFRNPNPLKTAKACFDQNVNQFVNVNKVTNPDNYNLYTGLQHLVAAVAAIQRDIQEIKDQLARR